MCLPSFPYLLYLGFIQVVHMVVYLLFLSPSVPFYEHGQISSLHIPVDGYLGCPQCLGHMSKLAADIMVHVFW